MVGWNSGLELVPSCNFHFCDKDKMVAAGVRIHFFLKPLPDLLGSIKEIHILHFSPNLILFLAN